ncbi:hypothetical protein D3C78_798800 [compost metagenome]
MVGDDGGDGHVQLALVVAIEQVAQAVVELADHQQHAGRLCGAVQLPVHGEARGDVGEPGLDVADVALHVVVEAEHRAHEEAAGGFVVELRHLPDVAAVVRKEGRDRRHDAGHRRTGDLDDEMAGCVLHVGSSLMSKRRRGPCKIFTNRNIYFLLWLFRGERG